MQGILNDYLLLCKFKGCSALSNVKEDTITPLIVLNTKEMAACAGYYFTSGRFYRMVLGRERDFVLFHTIKHIYSPRAWAYNHLVHVLAFKAFIIPTILYQFQKDPFCLIILYDILFYFIHVYIAPGQGKTTLRNNFFLW